jgi:hydroxymethylpyrimidine pyrophosphatase-like HAD family hydrolase
MANSPEVVKRAAKGVTTLTNDEDGWAEGIERYVLAD